MSIVADRWCGTFDPDLHEARPAVLRLVVPELAEPDWERRFRRVRIAPGGLSDGGTPNIGVGPHTVVLETGGEPNRVLFSNRRRPSPMERELLVDIGVGHLLARQGLPVLHSCSFEMDGQAALGLGESFSGKSSVAAAVMRAGGRVVSDDVALVIRGSNGCCSLLPVRSYGWFRGRTREIVPAELQEKMYENEEDGQPRWTLSREDAGDHFVGRSTPNVIWIQSIDRRLKEGRVEPVDQGKVFAALIRASSPLYLSRHCPEVRDKLIPVFRALCEQCRGYRVRLAPRLLEDPVGEMERLIDLSR